MTRDENAADCGIRYRLCLEHNQHFFRFPMLDMILNPLESSIVHFRKENLTVKECALGYRYKNILDNLGISDDENLQIFLKDAYRLCNQLDVNKAVMQDCLLEMIRIAKEEIPPSQLKESIQGKRARESVTGKQS